MSATAPNAAAGTIPYDLHRKRRAALNPYFSKQSVRRLEPVVKVGLVKLLNRMSVHERTGEIFPLSLAYEALTCDIITNYAFGESTNYLDRDDYNISYFDAVASGFELTHLLLHFGWLGPLMNSLPIALTEKLFPGLASLNKMRQVSLAPYSLILLLSSLELE